MSSTLVGLHCTYVCVCLLIRVGLDRALTSNERTQIFHNDWVYMHVSYENKHEHKGLLPDCSIGVKESKWRRLKLNVLAAHTVTYFLLNLHESDNCVTKQAVSDRQQNIWLWWQGLLQVIAWHYRSITAGFPWPATSQFECESLAHAQEGTLFRVDWNSCIVSICVWAL